MKKIMFVLGLVAVFFTASAFISTENNNTIPGPGGSCKIVGNCTVNLNSKGHGQYSVSAVNNNSYKVTVEWSAIGYMDGKERRVGSGTLSLNPKGEDGYSKTSYTFTTSCEDVGLSDVHVLKCD